MTDQEIRAKALECAALAFIASQRIMARYVNDAPDHLVDTALELLADNFVPYITGVPSSPPVAATL